MKRLTFVFVVIMRSSKREQLKVNFLAQENDFIAHKFKHTFHKICYRKIYELAFAFAFVALIKYEI